MTVIASTNPAENYLKLGETVCTDPHSITQAVALAHQAKTTWSRLQPKQRAQQLVPFLKQLQQKKQDLAELVSKEIGRPITQSLAELDWDEHYLTWFLTEAPKYLAPELTFHDHLQTHTVTYEPLGVAAVIAPWNSPFNNCMWGVVPNLIAGNTVVFKHAKECLLSAQFIDSMMQACHLPTGVFTSLYGDRTVANQLVNEDINLIWFTGSSRVGRELAATAGKKMIRAILELGGSNPSIVFEDADLSTTIPAIVQTRWRNAGQTCDALKRLIVHKRILPELLNELKKQVSALKIGKALEATTEISSLASKKQLETLKAQVDTSIAQGAVVSFQNSIPSELSGAYYPPTILTHISRTMPVWTEEVFGPVLPIMTFTTEQEAIELANDTPYGLGARIYTADINRAQRVAEQIDAGAIDCNTASHWQPWNPFGGHKLSGTGVEHGKWGMHDLCKLKVTAMPQA